MSRSTLVLRDAVLDDVPALVVLWKSVLRRGEDDERSADLRQVLAEVAVDPDQKVLVAESAGEVVGAVYVRATTLSPLNLEPTVQVIAPQVTADHRRQGAGVALMEAALSFAEERGVALVGAAALSGSRDGNRFLARLGFTPAATLRLAPATALRGKLAARRPASRGVASGPLSQVLAARRSTRRAQPEI